MSDEQTIARRDLATKERLAKGDVVIIHGERGGFEQRSFSNPLDFYRNREWITPAQFDAGNRYGGLFHVAFAHSRYAQVRYTNARGEPDPDLALRCEDQFDKAHRSIRGNKERKLALEVCCYGYPAGNGNLRALRSALDDLDAHFTRRRS